MSSERESLLPTSTRSTPSSSQRKAQAASKTQRFRQTVALVVGTALITALLYEMTPDTPDASAKSKLGPVHIQRDAKYPFARFFATKTAYWDQRDGAESNQELLTAYENALLREDLQLRQSYLVIRHGVRCVLSIEYEPGNGYSLPMKYGWLTIVSIVMDQIPDERQY